MPDKDDIVELEGLDFKTPEKRWKATPEVFDLSLSCIAGVLPSKLRASEKRFEEFYEHGKLRYKAGHYQDAKKYFGMLMMGYPQNAKYIFAFGACCHMAKEYYYAIQTYSMASILDPDSPLPLYHAADCYIKLLDPFGAAVTLAMGIDRCNSPRYAQMKDRMTMMLERIKNELVEKRDQGAKSFYTITPEEEEIMRQHGAPSIHDIDWDAKLAELDQKEKELGVTGDEEAFGT